MVQHPAAARPRACAGGWSGRRGRPPACPTAAATWTGPVLFDDQQRRPLDQGGQLRRGRAARRASPTARPSPRGSPRPGRAPTASPVKTTRQPCSRTEPPRGLGEALRRVPARGGRRARVDHDPGRARVDRRADRRHRADARRGPRRARAARAARRPAGSRPSATRSSWRRTSWRTTALGLGLGDPVGQQLVGVLAAVGQPQRDVGQVAEQGRGQRVLAEDGEDHGRVEPRPRGAARSSRGRPRPSGRGRRGLHPGGLVDRARRRPRAPAAAAAPEGEVSSVTRRPGRDSVRARRAGVVISTSPIASSRTQRMLLGPFPGRPRGS